MVNSALPTQRVQVQFLVRKLKFCMPWGMTKKKKEKVLKINQ